MNKKIKIIIGLVLSLILITIGGKIYMDNKQKQAELEATYQPGFRLLEEQIATYIKENFSGVSKIEFSPIYVDGDNKFTMLTADVVPVIYDEYGNRALLGKDIGNQGYGSYGLLEGLWIDYHYNGNQIIYLTLDGEVDVSGQTTLPEYAKLTYNQVIDQNITDLNKDKQLRNVMKNQNGSPEAKIIYNLEVKRGDYTKWD